MGPDYRLPMYVEHRKRLVDWLRCQLIGPASDHSLRTSPLDRYPTGVLHPVDPDLSGVDPAAAHPEEAALLDEQEAATEADDGADDPTLVQPARRRRYVPPSSVGFSCFLRGETRLSITASAALYRSEDDRDEHGRFRTLEYVRHELPDAAVMWPDFAPTHESRATIWDGLAGIDVRARPHRDGRVVTVTLYNRLELDANAPPNMRTRDRVSKSLFEARLECAIENGDLVEYPRIEPSLLTEEEQELELQYRNKRIYAIGHGAAANWDMSSGRHARIWSEFMPEAEVPMMTVDIGGDDAVLDLERLANAPMPDALAHFVDRYADWIGEQERVAAGLGKREERDAAHRIRSKMQAALGRMRNCVEMLRTDKIAADSFQLANRAMLDQMIQSYLIAGKEVEPGTYRWRPFQLAFLLTVMESTIREDDEYRDVLDLIWFPTGGGKTEAYLGLIAFLIVWRRRRFPDSGGGTTALMRYTLRLLTRQQFERAARMVVDTRSRPPELIVQDELHLITGPLGSVAGLYEAGLDTLLVRRGVRPEYVASTATIRMANDQVRRLYGRDLAVFPPPGLSYDDTFFARTDRERPGRLYLGFLTPMLDQQHCPELGRRGSPQCCGPADPGSRSGNPTMEARSCFPRRAMPPGRAVPSSCSGIECGARPGSRMCALTTSVTRMPATR